MMRAHVWMIILALFPREAAAALVELDHPAFGAKSLTLDTSTGLQWLDIANTVNYSFNEISAQFGDAGSFGGFRHGTVAEVVSLWNAAGIPCPQTLACDLNVFDNGGADLLLPLIGWSFANDTAFNAEGIVAEPGPLPGEHYRGRLEGGRLIANHTQVRFEGGLPDSYSSPYVGHWLVVVPEPSSGTLSLLGLLVLGLLGSREGTAGRITSR